MAVVEENAAGKQVPSDQAIDPAAAKWKLQSLTFPNYITGEIEPNEKLHARDRRRASSPDSDYSNGTESKLLCEPLTDCRSGRAGVHKSPCGKRSGCFASRLR